MSAPVDVLARAVERLRAPHPEHAQDAANNAAAIALHEYSAAVAELIAAGKRAERLLRDMADAGFGDPAQADELRAALARVGEVA